VIQEWLQRNAESNDIASLLDMNGQMRLLSAYAGLLKEDWHIKELEYQNRIRHLQHITVLTRRLEQIFQGAQFQFGCRRSHCFQYFSTVEKWIRHRRDEHPAGFQTALLDLAELMGTSNVHSRMFTKLHLEELVLWPPTQDSVPQIADEQSEINALARSDRREIVGNIAPYSISMASTDVPAALSFPESFEPHSSRVQEQEQPRNVPVAFSFPGINQDTNMRPLISKDVSAGSQIWHSSHGDDPHKAHDLRPTNMTHQKNNNESFDSENGAISKGQMTQQNNHSLHGDEFAIQQVLQALHPPSIPNASNSSPHNNRDRDESEEDTDRVSERPRIQPKGRKTHACSHPGCRKVYTRSTTLRDHLRKHTGERPFKCSTCEMDFAWSKDRDRHQITIHSGEKSYICQGYSCIDNDNFHWGGGRRFVREDGLAAHFRSDAGWECISQYLEYSTEEVRGDFWANITLKKAEVSCGDVWDRLHHEFGYPAKEHRSCERRFQKDEEWLQHALFDAGDSTTCTRISGAALAIVEARALRKISAECESDDEHASASDAES